MNPELQTKINFFLGLIGTLSGLSALVINFLKFKKEKVDIKACFIINYDRTGLIPIDNHSINIISKGNYDVYLDKIVFYLKLHGLQRIYAYKYYNDGRYQWPVNIKQHLPLKHGQSINIKVQKPVNVQYKEIKKICVVDERQHKWKVKWIFDKMKNSICIKEIYNKTHSLDSREINIHGYQGYKRKFIFVDFIDKSEGSKGSTISQVYYSFIFYYFTLYILNHKLINRYLNKEVNKITLKMPMS